MRLQDFLDDIENYEIPSESPDGLSFDGYSWHHSSFVGDMDRYTARDRCRERGMWAIITRSFARQLAGWIGDRKVLEIMAGAGWLAKALRDEGVNIIATDNGDWDERHSKMRFLTRVVKMEATEAVAANPDAEILLVSWPPYGELDIVEACEAWGGGRLIVYIGEGDSGCNAPEEFFKCFKELPDPPDIDVMSWDGIHDHVFFGYWQERADAS